MDANLSMDRLIRGSHGPWVDTSCFTVIGSSVVLMRRRLAGQISVRLLHGRELISMQGWSGVDYAGGRYMTSIDNRILSSLAGNAFSGFAVGAVMLASVPIV